MPKPVFYTGLHESMPLADGQMEEVTIEDFTWQLAKDFYESLTFFCFAEDGSVVFTQLGLTSLLKSHEPAMMVKYTPAGSTAEKDLTRDAKVKGSFKDCELTNENLAIAFKNQSFSYDPETQTYTVKAGKAGDVEVEMTLTSAGKGYRIGPKGTTLYNEDKKSYMYQSYLMPRAAVKGVVRLGKGKNLEEIAFEGPGYVGKVRQNIKPHHNACQWHLAKMSGPNGSVNVTQYTTPNSYGAVGVSNVSVTTKEGELIAVGAGDSVTYQAEEVHEKSGYVIPKAYTHSFDCPNLARPGTSMRLTLELKCDNLFNHQDMLSDLPWALKIVVQAFISKPYIWSWNQAVTVKLTLIDAEGKEEEMSIDGQCLHEVLHVNPL